MYYERNKIYENIKYDLLKTMDEKISLDEFKDSLKRNTTIIKPAILNRWFNLFIDLKYIELTDNDVIFLK